MMKKRGMIEDAPSNENIDQCIHWYFSVMSYRDQDYNAGMIKALTISSFKELYNEIYSYLHYDYMREVIFAIDREYINLEFKRRNDEMKQRLKK